MLTLTPTSTPTTSPLFFIHEAAGWPGFVGNRNAGEASRASREGREEKAGRRGEAGAAAGAVDEYDTRDDASHDHVFLCVSDKLMVIALAALFRLIVAVSCRFLCIVLTERCHI